MLCKKRARLNPLDPYPFLEAGRLEAELASGPGGDFAAAALLRNG